MELVLKGVVLLRGVVGGGWGGAEVLVFGCVLGFGL